MHLLGIDLTHHPEFTMCEFYQAYGNLDNLITMTEELISGAAIEITGTDEISSIRGSTPTTIHLKVPFARINVLEELEKNLGHALFPLNESKHTG